MTAKDNRFFGINMTKLDFDIVLPVVLRTCIVPYAHNTPGILTSGVTANSFHRNLFASGSVPDFQKISKFVPDGQRSMFL